MLTLEEANRLVAIVAQELKGWEIVEGVQLCDNHDIMARNIVRNLDREGAFKADLCEEQDDEPKTTT